jgi:signal transduction histidine kinase
MEARLVAVEVAGDNYQTLFLRSDRTEFRARLQKSRGEFKASRLTVGSLVRVTGICARETPDGSVPAGFGLLLRSPQDLHMLELPPSPASGLESGILWGATLALLLGFGWLALSMRRVERKTEAIRRRESSLEEIQNEKSTRKTLEERERIARDLHDGIIQSIYAVGLNLENCKRLVNEKPADVEGHLAKVLSDLNGVIRDVRNFILGLESDTLRGQEFKTALKSIVLTLGEAHAPRFGLQIESLAAEHLTSHQATQLLHIAREAVSNSVRHAQAERTVLSLQPNQGKVRFEVRDNGMGFDPKAVQSDGRGLRNMASRARDLQAEFSVDSRAGQGTRIVLDIPVKNPHEPA